MDPSRQAAADRLHLRWVRVGSRVGCGDRRDHARHTCASLMRAAGADVKEIRTRPGHRSLTITLSIYTHLFEDAFDSVMDVSTPLMAIWCGPDVVEFPEQRPSQVSEQGV